MTQPNEIPELLTRLHGALAGAPSLTRQDRALLEQLAADIQAVLARPAGTPAAAHAPLAARLAAAVARFEVTHPDLSGALNSVGKVLGDMGI